jgi:hypothetical protein
MSSAYSSAMKMEAARTYETSAASIITTAQLKSIMNIKPKNS